MVWYSHLFKNFPQFVLIHTVKGFSAVSKVEVGVFLELSCFLYDPRDVGNLISGSSVFSKVIHVEVLGSHTAEPSLKDFGHLYNKDFIQI